MASTDKIISSENLLKKACQKSGVSQSGMRWLEFATDPMHDRPLAAEGYPDQIMIPSTVQIVRKQMTVVTTSGTSTWDCSMFHDVVQTNVATVATSTSGQQVYESNAQGVTVYNRGGIVVRQDVTGAPLGITKTTQNLTLDTSYYSASDSRIVAMGFEVHNTTNKLNVGGSATVWRLPIPAEKDVRVANLVVDRGTTACIPTSVRELELPNPPNTVAVATNLPGSQTWKAEQGAYVIPVMTDEENSPDGLREVYPFQIDDVPVLYAPVITTTGAAKLMTSNVLLHETPFSCGGVFFSGLPSSTSLTVNAIWIVERFPRPTNVDLTTLARPSNPYDFKALRMYSEITRNLAPGVVVSANSMGDWFGSIAKIAMSAAPAVMGILSGSANLGGLLTRPGNSDPMLALTVPSKYNPGMEQSTLGYLGSKAFDVAKTWISTPSSNTNQQIVKREEIQTIGPETRQPGIGNPSMSFRQPLVFVNKPKSRRKLSAINKAVNLSQNSGTRALNVWSKEERREEKQRRQRKQ